MAAGITRVNGTAQAGTFHGGYQLKFFSVSDTGYDATPGAVNSKFEKAVRAIEKIATVVILGTPTSSGFIVGVDGGSFYGRGDATGYAATTGAADLQAAITAANDACTVAEVVISGLTFA
jgi:phage tail sheath gpL-like